MLQTKIVLAVAVVSVMVAVAVAPTMLTKAFASTVVTGQTCANGGGQTKGCTSPSCATMVTTTQSGTGKGGGETKTTTSSC